MRPRALIASSSGAVDDARRCFRPATVAAIDPTEGRGESPPAVGDDTASICCAVPARTPGDAGAAGLVLDL
jgi:hypothetical protein